MTAPELNELPFIALNIKRITKQIEIGHVSPGFFLPCATGEEAPILAVFRAELDQLMQEYQRRMNYIESIPDQWTRHLFELRYIERKTFREIGTEYGITSGTLKQAVYSYLRRNPEGYVSCVDLAEAWGLNVNTVNQYCRKGLLPGAKKRRGLGSHGNQRWIIPSDVKRP